MSQVLMPKATAVWLVENTTLTFDQISAFTGLHPLEIQAIADGEVAGGMTGLDPTTNGQLTKEEIKRAEADPAARLKLSPRDVPMPVARSKGPRYTPVAKRQDRPDAIAWLLKIHPELQDSQVAKLVGSTKSTVQSVRDRTPLEHAERAAARSGDARPVQPEGSQRRRRQGPPQGRARGRRPQEGEGRRGEPKASAEPRRRSGRGH